MKNNRTNVKASQLNYDKYSSQKYDKDIVNSIPFHREIHKRIIKIISKKFDRKNKYLVLDLGVGTGITTKLVQDLLPNSEFDVVDFSRQMLDGARKKLGKNRVNYILGDYSKLKFNRKYDIIISVIGMHHQKDKEYMFQRIYSLLNKGGIFLFGDLVTYRDKREAALNNALHYKHLVDYATDKKTLKEWAHHHMFLNDLAPLEDQIKWFKQIGFSVKKEFLGMNTALLVCKK